MATELTYTTLANQLAPRATYPSYDANIQARWATWMLVEMLQGRSSLWGSTPSGVWTIDSSCDGTAFDNTDRWWNGGTFDHTLMPSVAGGGTGNFAWMVLKSPVDLPGTGLYNYCTISLNADNGDSNYIGPLIYFSKTQPSGGGLSTRPSATDEYRLCQQDGVNGGTFYVVDRSIVQDHYVHMVLATRGDFYFWTSFTGGGNMFSSVFHTRLQDTKSVGPSADLNKTASYCWGYPGADINSVSCFRYDGGYNYQNVFRTPSGDYGYWGGGSRLRGRNYADPPSASAATVQLVMGFVGSNYVSAMQVATAPLYSSNESDGSYNEWYVPVFSTYEPVSVGSTVVDSTKPHRELKGRIADVKVASGALLQCAVRPASAPYEYIKLGDLWFPWTASTGPEI